MQYVIYSLHILAIEQFYLTLSLHYKCSNISSRATNIRKNVMYSSHYVLKSVQQNILQLNLFYQTIIF